MDDNPIGRMFGQRYHPPENLNDALNSMRIEDYAQMVAPQVLPVTPPVAVEHRPAPQADRVNFIIKGVADFTPECYRGPSMDRVKSEIVDAIQQDPSVGSLAFKPSVYFEITDVWDYTGGEREQEDHQHRGAARANQEVEGDLRQLIKYTYDDIKNNYEHLAEFVAKLKREIDDDRTARAMEAAVRPHGGDLGAGASLHGGGEQAVPDGDQQRDRRPRRGRGTGDSGQSRGSSAGGPGESTVHPDAGTNGRQANADEVRGDDPSISAPVVDAGSGDHPGDEGER